MLSGYRLQDRHLLLQDNHHHESQWAHIKSHMWAMRAPIIGKIQMEFSVSSNMRSDEVEFNVWVIRIHAIRKYSPTHIEKKLSKQSKQKEVLAIIRNTNIYSWNPLPSAFWLKKWRSKIKTAKSLAKPFVPCKRALCSYNVHVQSECPNWSLKRSVEFYWRWIRSESPYGQWRLLTCRWFTWLSL